MLSSGGVAPVEEAAKHPAAMLLSGPAGGAVAARLVAGLDGDFPALGFDMGGTSCDTFMLERAAVSRVRRRPSRRRAADPAADGRHPHGQRRRRLDRVGRRRRRAPRRSRQRRRDARSGLLRPRRRAADRHRRRPRARLSALRPADRRWPDPRPFGGGGGARPARRRGGLRIGRRGGGRRRRCRREPARAGAARRLGRARPRPRVRDA